MWAGRGVPPVQDPASCGQPPDNDTFLERIFSLVLAKVSKEIQLRHLKNMSQFFLAMASNVFRYKFGDLVR